MELGNKFPREPEALKKALAPFGMACVVGLVFGRTARQRDADAEMKAPAAASRLLKAMGSKVLIFAETSNAIHGDRSKPLSQRPVMKRGDWAELRAPRHRRSPSGRCRKACAWSITTTWARSSNREADIDAFMARHGRGRRICCSTPATPPGAAPIPRALAAPLSRPHQPCPHQGRAQEP